MRLHFPSIFVLVVACVISLNYSDAHAQDSLKKSVKVEKNKVAEGSGGPVKLQFTHTPPKADELPAPGMPLKINVRVNKEALASGVILRAIVTRDGTLFEQQNTTPQIDTTDKISYIIEVPAPLLEMSYQFVFIDKLGNAVGTKRYGVRRKCVPEVIFPSKLPATEGANPNETPESLRKTGEQLESEIALLELATTSITQLQESIDKK